MQHAASGVTQEMFPDTISVNGLALPLEYHLEPGHPADGVTVAIPLPLLNQLPAARFEWLVPGFLKEKITALIKSLPKQLRVNYVPAPDFAEAACNTLEPGDGSLLEGLALFLGKQSGQQVHSEVFDPTTLLDHLHMNFKIVDQAGKQLAMGRDLNQLRQKLGVQVKATFADLPHPQFHRDNIREWDFGDLPESVSIQRHGMALTAFPALVDNGNSVSLRLLDSLDSARQSHRAGLRRLFVLQLRDELPYLASSLPNIHELRLHYATLGSPRDLIDDMVGETINRAFLPDIQVRSQMEFELRLSAGRRHRLLEIGREVSDLAGRILAAYHAVALLLGKPLIPAFAPALADVREQLAYLLPKNFMTVTPDEWLVHFPRFLKAIQLRIQKLSTAGHSRDAQHLADISPFWQAYKERLKYNRERNLLDPALEHFRWMIEELRVSLFAQELKTSIPISPKRLEKQWELVRK
jgi:ATP-dependent helicase HrpA